MMQADHLKQSADVAQESRRQHERAPLNLDVTLEGDHNFFAGLTENLSEGGLFVATHTLRDVGAQIALQFTLPGRDAPVRVKGEVRWVRIYNEASDAGPGMGIRFLDLADQDKAAIADFIGRRSPIFWDD